MAGAAEEEVPPKKARTAYYYGDEDTADVMLIAGDCEFHVHRRFLAFRSSHFKEIFSAHPSAENGKVSITLDENVYDFKCMLNMLYKQAYWDDDVEGVCEFASLDRRDDEEVVNQVKCEWVWLLADVRIAEKYNVLDIVRPTLERHMNMGNCGESTCLLCASRNLRSKITVDTLIASLSILSSHLGVDLPVFHIAPAAFACILDGIIGERTQEKLNLVTDDNASNDTEAPLHVVKYGRDNVVASDVTLIAGNTAFQVHKHFLALNSPVFTAMFFIGFDEKNKETLDVDADVAALKGIMDVLYKNRIEDDVDFLVCNRRESQEHIIRFWERMPPIMQLFDYYDLPSRLIEDLVELKSCRKIDCIECASKKLFAMHYDLKALKKKIPYSSGIIVSCIRKFQEVLPDPLKLIPAELIGLIKAAQKKFPAMS